MRAAMIAVVLVACGGERTAPPAPDPNAALRDLVRGGPFIDIEMRQIAVAYEENAIAADAMFRGKAIRTTGNIVEIATDATITVLDRDTGATIRCEWGGSRADAAALKREYRYVRGIGGEYHARVFTMRLCDIGNGE